MSAQELINEMQSAIIEKTNMLYPESVLDEIGDLMIRVRSVSEVDFEYAMTDGNEVFKTYQKHVFEGELQYQIDQFIEF